DNPLAGVHFQQKYEKLAFELGGKNYNAPVQLVGDFINNKTSLGIILGPYYDGTCSVYERITRPIRR
ncbi:FAD-dependent protein, partial [Clostridioides difficile]